MRDTPGKERRGEGGEAERGGRAFGRAPLRARRGPRPNPKPRRRRAHTCPFAHDGLHVNTQAPRRRTRDGAPRARHNGDRHTRPRRPTRQTRCAHATSVTPRARTRWRASGPAPAPSRSWLRPRGGGAPRTTQRLHMARYGSCQCAASHRTASHREPSHRHRDHLRMMPSSSPTTHPERRVAARARDKKRRNEAECMQQAGSARCNGTSVPQATTASIIRRRSVPLGEVPQGSMHPSPRRPPPRPIHSFVLTPLHVRRLERWTHPNTQTKEEAND